MDIRSELAFFQRRHTNGHQGHKKMLSITNIREMQTKPQLDITSHL